MESVLAYLNTQHLETRTALVISKSNSLVTTNPRSVNQLPRIFGPRHSNAHLQLHLSSTNFNYRLRFLKYTLLFSFYLTKFFFVDCREKISSKDFCLDKSFNLCSAIEPNIVKFVASIYVWFRPCVRVDLTGGVESHINYLKGLALEDRWSSRR